jgi:hypothetical protein
MSKELEAAMFAVNEKANTAYTKMNDLRLRSITQELENYGFYKGQFQAYSEVYTMLNNIKDSL